MSGWAAAHSWQAQVVSYPLYRAVGAEDFLAYHAQYNHAIPWVVVAPGFATFAAQVGFWWTRPAATPKGLAAVVAGGGLTAIAATVLWAIPRHARLDRIGQDAGTIDSLLQANLLRSHALTAAAAACVGALGQARS